VFHDDYVGHFDPCDPADLTVRPHRPKVQRPMDRQLLDRALAEFGPEVTGFVEWCESGYAICHWSAATVTVSQDVNRFARALADAAGAVVMTHLFQIVYSDAARELQERFFAGVSQGTWLHRCLGRTPGMLPKWLLSSTARGPKNDVLTWAAFFIATLLTAAAVIISAELGHFDRQGSGYLMIAIGPVAFTASIIFEVAAIEPCRKIERVARAIGRRSRADAGHPESG